MHMPTLTEFAILGCVLIAGLILGMVINAQQSIWRRRFDKERNYYRQYRDRTEALNQQKSRRIADLEAQLAARADTVAPSEATAAAPDPEATADEAGRGGSDRGAPDFAEQAASLAPRQDAQPPYLLGRIRGIDTALAAKLAQLGVHDFGDIESLSAEDEMALEQRLGIPAGLITRDQWRLQAALLGTGEAPHHGQRFGP